MDAEFDLITYEGASAFMRKKQVTLKNVYFLTLGLINY